MWKENTETEDKIMERASRLEHNNYKKMVKSNLMI